MINIRYLREHINPNANKYLFIFPNKRRLDMYKSLLKRDDIIYKTECSEIIGLRYKDFCFIYNQTKEEINEKYKENK